MPDEIEDVKGWRDAVAELAVDALVEARLIEKASFRPAVEIVAEEILVRLALNDYPPFE